MTGSGWAGRGKGMTDLYIHKNDIDFIRSRSNGISAYLDICYDVDFEILFSETLYQKTTVKEVVFRIQDFEIRLLGLGR